MKKLLLLAGTCMLCWSPVFTAWAQLDQVLRIEIPISEKDEEKSIYDVVSLREKGLLVSTQPRYTHDDNVWTFNRLDTNLQSQWKITCPVEEDFEPSQTFLDSSYYYVLVVKPDTKKFKIFQLDINEGDFKWMEGDMLTQVAIADFKILGGTAFIGGMVNTRPVVFTYNFFDKRVRVLPGLYEPRTELNHIQVDPYRQVSNVLIYNQEKNRGKLSLRSFDYSGKQINNVILESPKEKGLVTGRLTSLNNKEQLIMGYYTYKNLPYSQGLFMAKLNGDSQEYIKYFQFTDFKNFFTFMKPRRQERIREKIEKKREKGKELMLYYRLLLHDIIETPTQYILVAEAFYPQYNSGYGNYGTYNMGAYSRMYGDRVFDGYRYTHAVLCGFDKQGNLLWDNSFEIQDVVTYSLQEVVQVSIDEDKIILAYPEDGEIHTKVIQGNNVVKEKEKFKIATSFEEDKVIHSDDVSIDQWYSKYFISWGTQEIHGPQRATAQRKVFYLNKITYTNSATTRKDEK